MSDLRADAPAEVRFLFQESRTRSSGAVAASFAIHAALFALAFYVARNADVAQVTKAFDTLSDQIVWLDVPGPGGGGGGGGNASPEPVKKVELKGKEKITVPVEKPPAMEQPKDKPPPEEPIQNLTIPAQTLASADLAQAGALEGVPSSESLGLGRGGGAGTGQGTGIGPGRASHAREDSR
jgi:protein TonB